MGGLDPQILWAALGFLAAYLLNQRDRQAGKQGDAQSSAAMAIARLETKVMALETRVNGHDETHNFVIELRSEMAAMKASMLAMQGQLVEFLALVRGAKGTMR